MAPFFDNRPRVPPPHTNPRPTDDHTEVLLIAGARVTFGDGAQVTAMATDITAAESMSWIEPCLIRISWSRPFRIVRLVFANEPVATEVAFLFQIGRYQCQGHMLFQRDPVVHKARGGLVYIDVDGWPFDIDVLDIERLIDNEAHKPLCASIVAPQRPHDNVYDPEVAHQRVTALLQTVEGGPELEYSPGVAYQDPYVLVRPPRSASTSALKDSIIARSNHLLRVNLLQPAAWLRHETSKLTGDCLDRCTRALKGKPVALYPRSSSLLSGFQWIRIESDDIEALREARDILGDILAGQVVVDSRDGSKRPFWSSTFDLRRVRSCLRRELHRQYQVHCDFNLHERQIRIHGGFNEQSRHAAMQTLIRESRRYVVISLSRQQADWLHNEDNMHLLEQHLLSPRDATIKLINNNTRMLVHSSQATAEDDILAFIAAAMLPRARFREHRGSDMSDPLEESAATCSICLTTAIDPIETRSCKHQYCRGCFRDTCLQSGRDGKVSCFGDGGRCQTILSLGELRALLSKRDYEVMLVASFAGHVGRMPQKFRYCPTPDCGHIYQTTDSATPYICQNCFRQICSGCGNQHEPHTSCTGEGQDTAPEEATAPARNEAIKECPSCKTLIEKDPNDCNHVTCYVCCKHFCWVCLTTCDSGEAIYRHLDTVHGRRFNDETPFENHELRDQRLALRLQGLHLNGPIHRRDGPAAHVLFLHDNNARLDVLRRMFDRHQRLRHPEVDDDALWWGFEDELERDEREPDHEITANEGDLDFPGQALLHNRPVLALDVDGLAGDADGEPRTPTVDTEEDEE